MGKVVDVRYSSNRLVITKERQSFVLLFKRLACVRISGPITPIINPETVVLIIMLHQV